MPTPNYNLPLYSTSDTAALDVLLNGQSNALDTALAAGEFRSGGTDAQRTALAAPRRKRGLEFYATDTGREWLYDGTNWNRRWPAVKVRRNTAQSMPNGAFTSLSWDTEVFDNSNMWSLAFPTRLIAPVPGAYMVAATGGINSSVSGRIGLQFRKNGTGTEFGGSIVIGGSGEIGPSPSTLITLNAGEYVEVQMYQESGAAQNTAPSGYSQPTASMFLVADL